MCKSSISVLYNEESENEIKKVVSLTIAQKKEQYSGISVTKGNLAECC
jgi:hypothetical protein